MKARLRRWVRPLFGVCLLALLATRVDARRFVALLERGDPAQLAVAVGSFLVALAGFQTARLHVLVRPYTETLAGSFRLSVIGAFFNNLLPSGVGGDAVRLYYLRRRADGDWAAPLSLLMLHRATGLLALGLAFLVYAPLFPARLGAAVAGLRLELGTAPLVVLAVFVLCACVALALVLRTRVGAGLRERLHGFARRFASGLAQVDRRTLWLLAALTLAYHGMRMFGFWACVAFFGESIAFWDLIPVLAVTAVIALLPLTVGGLGLVEGSLSVGLSIFGVGTEAAVFVALVHRGAMLLVAATGGVTYALQRHAGPAAVEER